VQATFKVGNSSVTELHEVNSQVRMCWFPARVGRQFPSHERGANKSTARSQPTKGLAQVLSASRLHLGGVEATEVLEGEAHPPNRALDDDVGKGQGKGHRINH
jgi:hypothetical protein